jgi:DNA-binding response OmpR family regulator
MLASDMNPRRTQAVAHSKGTGYRGQQKDCLLSAVPCHLFPVPYLRSPVTCPLSPVPFFGLLSPIPCSLSPLLLHCCYRRRGAIRVSLLPVPRRKPMTRTILVIEDEAAIRRGVVDALRASGYRAIEASDGRTGLETALTEPLDLVLLDLILPGYDGMKVLAQLRRNQGAPPVIILTARGSEPDRVAGLKAGADDYVVKPFSARELLARVEAVLRRARAPVLPIRRAMLGDTWFDFARREMGNGGARDDSSQDLSETEWAILYFLVANRDRTVSREELLRRLWGIADGIETRTIDMHVARLRHKLRAASQSSIEPIVTVRGQGYMASRDFAVETSSL